MQTRVRYANETRADDKELWEVQLVALQDTRKLTRSEVERLRVVLVNSQRAQAYQQHKEVGAVKIAQLQDDISITGTITHQNCFFRCFEPKKHEPATSSHPPRWFNATRVCFVSDRELSSGDFVFNIT